ncbi:MAG TPA: hypothetical protein VEC37_01325, partial [Bacillota bacterium]|nr:hypothetical protein [Bacillota bacterium]
TNTQLQIQALENEKNEAIRIAKEQGLTTTEIEKVYAEKKKTINQNLNDAKAQFAKEWSDKLLSINSSDKNDFLEVQRAEDLKQATAKGFDTTAINKYYDALTSNDFKTRWDMGLKEALRGFGTFGENIHKAAVNIADSMQSAFADGFFSIIKGNFDGLGDAVQSFLDSILKEITNMWAKIATQKIMGGVFGGMFGSAFQFAGGFANGGTIPANNYAIVGERGPELIKVGSAGATVTPNHALGPNVQVNIINNAGSQVKVTHQPEQVNGKQIVKNIILDLVSTDNNFRSALGMGR